jgi:hypothetical protein
LIKRSDPKGPEVPAEQAPAKVTPAKAKPLRSESPQNDGISVSCMKCGKELRAPERAAGKAIRCPGCQSPIPVPDDISIQTPQFPAFPTNASQRANPHPDNAFQDDSVWSSIPSPSANLPYAGATGFDAPYTATASYGGAGASRGSTRASRVIQYNIIGVLMMVWSGLIVLGCIVRPIVLALAIINLPPNATINYDKLTPILIGTGIGIAIGLAMAYVIFQGGYNIYYQSNLESAKQIAIFCAIPCCGSCLFPVGIWACFLVFGKYAKRDFGG